MSDMRDAIYIECWFLISNVIVKVNFLKFAEISKDIYEMVAFSAFLMLNLNDVVYFNKN